MLKTTASNVFVSYAEWLSKITVNHCDALRVPAQVILVELKSDEVFAKIEALGPEHFEQAIELLKEVQLIRKKTVAAELLEHDTAFNEVVEQINEVNSSISTNWAHVSPEVSCPAVVKMPSEATKVFQNVGKHICLFSFEQNYNRKLKQNESRKERVEVLSLLPSVCVFRKQSSASNKIKEVHLRIRSYKRFRRQCF